MWPTTNDLPEFGVLRGVKVLHATMAQAAPFGVCFLADYGADVIWLENALMPDVRRSLKTRTVEGDSRNQRNLALNIPSDEGRKIFFELLKEADIFVECSKGGQYDKWGLSDEVLWEVNPRLVIVHQSGFGQTGDPRYVNRPSYDAIAQAYSSYMDANKNPITDPYPVGPFIGDFMTGLYVTIAALAGLTKARESGQGESIDVAQYECLARSQQYQADWLTDHRVIEYAGQPSTMAGWGTIKCKDGAYIQLCFAGAKVIKNACEFFGVPYGTDDIPENIGMLYIHTPGGDLLRNTMTEYCQAHDSEEIQELLLSAGLPAQKVNSMGDLEKDIHAQARELFAEWKSFNGDTIKGVRAVPTFKNNPTQIWRGAPWWGMDNEDILGQLGYSEDEIKKLYDEKIISKDAEGKLVYPWR